MALWILLQNLKDWLYYGFNIWVSLFSIMLVSPGWLIAANVFNSREAKRVYSLLGAGAVIGARLLRVGCDDFYDLLSDNMEITASIFATLVKRFRQLVEQ